MKKLFSQNCIGCYEDGLLIGKDSVETFINYKLLNSSKLKFDCDSSPLVKRTLKCLFGEAIYTDTLISPQDLFTLYIRYFHSDILIEEFGKLVVPGRDELKKEMYMNEITPTNSAIWSFYVLKRLKQQDIKFHESMVEFLDTVYSLGNFSTVCRGFNLGRYGKTKDSLFIALDKIRLYFISKENGAPEQELRMILSTFLSEAKIRGKVFLTEEEVITEVVNWLSSFKNYQMFITQNKLQSFLENPEDSDSRPKELWKGLFDGTNCQPTKGEFINCIKVMKNAIEQRGIKMYETLRGMNVDSEKY